MNASYFLKAFCFLFFFFTSGMGMEHFEYPLLIHNAVNEDVLPRQFRMTTSIIDKPLSPEVSDLGLLNLNASASGQFSEQGLVAVLKIVPSNQVLVIDLREEAHGFINGDGVSWYGYRNWTNKGRPLAEIEADEQERLKNLSHSGLAKIQTKTSPRIAFEMLVADVEIEKNIVRAHGAEYIRLPSTDHMRPEDGNVDQFLKIIKELPQGTWIHFHCAAGKGRASTYFVMYDMMRNAKMVSFEDIIERQEQIGGKDLGEIEEDSWKYPYEMERIQFLQDFYSYCREGYPEKKMWTQWTQSKKTVNDSTLSN